MKDLAGQLLPGSLLDYVREHPKVLEVASIALIAFNLYNLMDSIGLYHRVKAAIAEMQRAASEALGG